MVEGKEIGGKPESSGIILFARSISVNFSLITTHIFGWNDLLERNLTNIAMPKDESKKTDNPK
jgi:hypothetical protein